RRYGRVAVRPMGRQPVPAPRGGGAGPEHPRGRRAHRPGAPPVLQRPDRAAVRPVRRPGPAAPGGRLMTGARPALSWSEVQGMRAGVWGLGVEGRASLRKLIELGAEPVLVDDRPSGPGPDGRPV